MLLQLLSDLRAAGPECRSADVIVCLNDQCDACSLLTSSLNDSAGCDGCRACC